ncbi:hypothetical protein PM082_012156 [Marasmius tenuissimus]|nr:hypothetical protein PM082_012156 [Marasmius tenuissimus]
MIFDFISIRAWLYIALVVFSFILLALCAARISFTNDVAGGYEASVVELLVSTILALLWTGFMLLLYFTSTSNRLIRFYRDELIALVILWLLWLGGAAAASDIFRGCSVVGDRFFGCRYTSAILAFAWLGWITLTALLGVSAYIGWKHGGLTTELHGRNSSRTTTTSASAPKV